MAFDELRVGQYMVSGLTQIGEGGFGLIYSCQDSRGTQFALKKCSIQRQETFDTVQKEIQILKRFKDCQYIVKIMGESVSMQSGSASILLEMCTGGHLLDRLNKLDASHQTFSTRDICRIFGQLLVVMNLMHTAKPRFVVHRDIKCENILFGGPAGDVVKVCDFGSVVEGVTPLRDVNERTAAEEIIGKETTLAYRAPEMVDLYMRNFLNEKTDVWACGCVLYCMTFLAHPFQEQGALGILNGATVPKHLPRDPRATVDESLRILIQRSLDVDMEARPTCGQLLDAVRAVEAGQPLPASILEIPQEAKDRKIEREAAAQRRAAKNKAAEQNKRGMAAIIANKKAALAAAPSANTASTNSVAAKRLAQLRGEPVNVRGVAPAPSSGGGRANFDPFGATDDPFATSGDMGSPKYLTPTSGSDDEDFFQQGQSSNTGAFNDFGGSGPASLSSSPVPNSDDFFGGGSDGFSASAAPVASGGDFFASSSATNSSTQCQVPSSANGSFAAFPSNNGFDEMNAFDAPGASSGSGFESSAAPATSAGGFSAFEASSPQQGQVDPFTSSADSGVRASFTSLPSPPPSNRGSVNLSGWSPSAADVQAVTAATGNMTFSAQKSAPVADAWTPAAPAVDAFAPSGSSDAFAPSGSSDAFASSGSSDAFAPSGSSDAFAPSGSSDAFASSGSSDAFAPSGSSDVFSSEAFASSATPVKSTAATLFGSVEMTAQPASNSSDPSFGTSSPSSPCSSMTSSPRAMAGGFTASESPVASNVNNDDMLGFDDNDVFGASSPAPASASMSAFANNNSFGEDGFESGGFASASNTTPTKPAAVDVLSLFDGLASEPPSAMNNYSAASSNAAMVFDAMSPMSPKGGNSYGKNGSTNGNGSVGEAQMGNFMQSNTISGGMGMGMGGDMGMGMGMKQGGGGMGAGGDFTASAMWSNGMQQQQQQISSNNTFSPTAAGASSAGNNSERDSGGGGTKGLDMNSFLMANISAPLQRNTSNNSQSSGNSMTNNAGSTKSTGSSGSGMGTMSNSMNFSVSSNSSNSGKTANGGPDPFANLMKF